MDTRDEILTNILTALKTEAPKPRELRGQGTGFATVADTTPEQLLATFTREFTTVKGQLYVANSPANALDILGKLCKEHHWHRLAVHSHPLTESILGGQNPSNGIFWVGKDIPGGAALEKMDVGVTVCDALVAQTGSILLTNRSAGGRALSVLPHHHVVIARASQLVPDLKSAFELLEKTYAPDYPSFVTFITGPSRTADIEKILVLGAHGPRQVFVLIIP